MGSSDFGKLVATGTKVGAPIGINERYPTPYHSRRCGARYACSARASSLHPSPLDVWGTGYIGRTGVVTGAIFAGHMHIAAADVMVVSPTLCGAFVTSYSGLHCFPVGPLIRKFLLNGVLLPVQYLGDRMQQRLGIKTGG